MTDQKTTIQNLKEMVAKFVEDRDWQKFHSPKNLSMSIAIEAAELMEKFQWLDKNESDTQIKEDKLEIENELADIFIYIISFCNSTNIDLSSAISRKLELNNIKYPIDKIKGKAIKYTKINY